MKELRGKGVEEGKEGVGDRGSEEVEEESGHEAEEGEGNEEGEEEVVEEAEVGELSEVVEEERKDGDVDGECEADRRAESGGEEIDDLRGE